MSLTPSSGGNPSAIISISANPVVRDRMIRALESCDCTTFEANGGAEIMARAGSASFDFAVLDRKLPDLDSDDVTRFLRQQNPNISYVLVDTSTGKLVGPNKIAGRHAAEVFRALQETESDFGLPEEEFILDEPRELEIVPRAKPRNFEPLPGMIGQSDSFSHVHRLARVVARRSSTVLLQGESGVGKDMVAYAIHQLSPRSAGPLVIVNCAAIPETLLESELFGYARGAFTGAAKQTLGKIELADGGTFFLDEVGDLPMALQAKLLRFLQERVIERIGGREEIPVNVRIVCATHQNLKDLIVAGRFREDLFYRLSEIVVTIPPLRARVGD